MWHGSRTPYDESVDKINEETDIRAGVLLRTYRLEGKLRVGRLICDGCKRQIIFHGTRRRSLIFIF